MNILVTGGLGFIGHNVVCRLEQLGHTITVADNKTNYGIVSRHELNALLKERESKFTARTYDIDIMNYPELRWLFGEHYDIVIHLASYPRQKVVQTNPRIGSRVMSEGLINLLELSRQQKCRFVYISSSMVYGDFEDNVKENAVCAPQGQYGIMKLAGEWLVRDYTRMFQMPHVILRPSAVYGPLDVEDRVVSKFLLNAMREETVTVNGSEEKLDFTYVDDVANGIVSAALSDNTENKTYNITRSRGRTLLDAALQAIEIVGSGNLEIKNRDMNFPKRGSLNIDAARRDFNFNPTVDIEQGFRNYYDWLSKTNIYDTTLRASETIHQS